MGRLGWGIRLAGKGGKWAGVGGEGEMGRVRLGEGNGDGNGEGGNGKGWMERGQWERGRGQRGGGKRGLEEGRFHRWI